MSCVEIVEENLIFNWIEETQHAQIGKKVEIIIPVHIKKKKEDSYSIPPMHDLNLYILYHLFEIIHSQFVGST